MKLHMYTGPRESCLTAYAVEVAVSLGVGGPVSFNRDNLKCCDDGKGENSHHCSGAFFPMRQLAAICLVMQATHLPLSGRTML
jgi:hypothetical protein